MRLFLALPLPPAVIALATEVQTCVIGAAACPSFRPVQFASATPHITLAFLGETSEEMPSSLRESAQTTLHALRLSSPPRLVARRIAASFGRSVNVAYVPVSVDEPMLAMQRALYAAASSLHPTLASHDNFNAHITVTRGSGRSRDARRLELAEACRVLQERNAAGTGVDEVVFDAERVALFESKKEDGAIVYEEIWSLPVVP